MNTRENISMTMTIRSERIQDIDAIARLTQAAFEQAPHTSHTEQFIVDALRRAGQLTVSLVAVENDAIVGHIAASPSRFRPAQPGGMASARCPCGRTAKAKVSAQR